MLFNHEDGKKIQRKQPFKKILYCNCIYAYRVLAQLIIFNKHALGGVCAAFLRARAQPPVVARWIIYQCHI